MNRDHGPLMGPYQMHHDHGSDPHVWGLLFFALVLVALIGLTVFLVMRYTARRPAPAVAQGAAALDQPLAVLRMRYARGEVSRSEFLQASEDLGGPPPPVAEPPPPA